MSRLIFVVMLLLLITPAFAGDNNQQEQINRGFDYIKSGNYQKATDTFNTVLLDKYDNADTYFGLGISYLKLGDNEVMTNTVMVEKAISAFRKAQKHGALNNEIHYYLGLCYLAIHHKDVAKTEYSILKDLDSELANQLLVRIDAYKTPKQYIKTGETVYPLPLGETEISQETPVISRRAISRTQSPSFSKCVAEAERRISFPEGTTRMSAKQRERAEAGYEQSKRNLINSCMGQPTIVIDREEPQERRKPFTQPFSSPPSGAIDVTTGEFYPPAAGGVINPRTGDFYPDVGGGYINPRTGDFMPKIK